MGKVTIVGSYIVALVMDTERIPLEGETVLGHNYHTTHGGKGSNMAVCAARLGAQSTFMGKIGDDAFGDAFVELLRSERVSREGVLISEKYPTAVGFIIFSARGSNSIVIDIAANGDFTPNDVYAQKHIIESADVVLSPLEIPFETAITASRLADSMGKKSILNPAPALDLRGKELYSVFALTPNETEGRVCLGLDPADSIKDEDLAVELLTLGVQNVILTRGAKGVIWASSKGIKSIPALQVKVVDSVGAGDAFNAGLAVGLSEKMPMPEAIAMGVTAASLSTQHRETIASYPSREQVTERLADILKVI